MGVTSGTKLSSDITAQTTSAGVGEAPDRRRLYDFSDRVLDLAPEESPFFIYLAQVSKTPTTDSTWRYLEDRTKIDWTSRDFYLAAAVNSGNAVTANKPYVFTVDDDDASSASSIDWLIKGMVFSVTTVYGSAGYEQILVRIEDEPSSGNSSTTFTGRIMDMSASSGDGIKFEDNDHCQVVGTAFKEGTASPDVWSNEIEDDYGYTQIFKTAAEMSNTAIATKYRGYPNEWARIWNLKLREHKVDIERAMLFSQKARRNGIQTTEGLVGHILKNGTAATDDEVDLSYSSGAPYLRSITKAGMTFDRFVSDMEVLFDPARGGSGDRLVLASLPIISWFNKLGDGTFAEISAGGSQYMPHRLDVSARDGAFGHKITQIDTIHGTLHLTKEPLFRGNSQSFMLFADMSKLSYRPLVGNGKSRDTHVETNVQNNDEDLRKDMILTEAGLEVGLPETQMLWNVEGYSIDGSN